MEMKSQNTDKEEGQDYLREEKRKEVKEEGGEKRKEKRKGERNDRCGRRCIMKSSVMVTEGSRYAAKN